MQHPVPDTCLDGSHPDDVAQVTLHDRRWMQRALRLARRSARAGEVPVAALVVCSNRLLAAGVNSRHRLKHPLGHAEVTALERAAQRLGDWRMTGCTLYVTLEPCAMCAGAMLEARLPRLVFGAWDQRAGAAGSVLDLVDYPGMSWHVQAIGGCLQKDCEHLLEEFFRPRRNNPYA
jgi:tRNA(adenine34) deaminase